MSSYGHAIGVNQMQMMQLFSAFANGGEMIRPQLIRQVGEETQVFPEVVSNVVQTAELIHGNPMFVSNRPDRIASCHRVSAAAALASR